MARNRRRRATPEDPTGLTNDLTTQLSAQDHESAFLSKLMGMGTDPFSGPTGYNDWLQDYAFDKADAAYGMAIRTNPELTYESFLTSYFADPANANAFSVDAYRPFHIQDNPRDYYNQMWQDGGTNATGASPRQSWLKGAGWDYTKSSYGVAAARQPDILFANWLDSSNPFRS
jgi:hypothetical protein